jgi:transglutaminase-like putative cysteine protease
LYFRVLNHVTLALACLCLIAAEDFFLSWIWWLAAPVLVLIALAGWSEGGWHLPASFANTLGAIIAVVSAFWMIEASGYFTAISALPLPTALVPYLGPTLLALMLVKLFRPRTPHDFWLLQGLALLQVALGCVLANGELFCALLAAYVCSALGCLALHHLQRQGASTHARPLPNVGFLVPFVARWGLAVVLLGVFLYLVAPRAQFQSWNPVTIFSGSNPSQAAQTGYADGINLNRTGTIEISDEPAFTVVVRDREGRPRGSLPLGQRWRGTVLEYYSDGIWLTLRRGGGRGPGGFRRAQVDLPDFGPNVRILDFSIDTRKAGGLFLADPICLGGPEGPRLPVVRRDGDENALFFESFSGVYHRPPPGDARFAYRQVVPTGADPERTPAEGLTRWMTELQGPHTDERAEGRARAAISYFVELKSSSSAALRGWGNYLLRRLVDEERYDLTEKDAELVVEGGQGRIPANAERVARALTALLATSGEYTYSLELKRQNLDIDPVLDFLSNVKQGHCERYASALTLLLRSRGIPARIVKGFRGWDAEGEGVYIIRQRHAHSWVEALVPRAGSNGTAFDWLTLDPTPDFESPSAPSRWYFFGWPTWDALWHDLVQDYDTERQATLRAQLFKRKTLRKLLSGVLVLAVAVAMYHVAIRSRHRPQRRQRPSANAPPETIRSIMVCLSRLMKVLARCLQVHPEAGETPLELARRGDQCLRACSGSHEFDDLPSDIVAAYYRSRFGEETIDPQELRQLEERLDRFELLDPMSTV